MSQRTLDIKTLFTHAKEGNLPVIESLLATNVFNINQLYPDSPACGAEEEGEGGDSSFSGLNLLMVACKYGHNALAKSLVQNHRANVNAQSSKQTCENTALGIVAATGNNELVAFLQSRGADINAGNANYDTPTHIACACGRGETVELLLRMGATFDVPNKAHETPLMLAAKSGLTSVVQTLIGKRANVKAVTRDGESVLHFAAQGGNPKVVQVLISSGADVTARCKTGKMPIDYCKDDKKKECRDVFEKEFARLQERANEYSKSFLSSPKKKKQPQQQQQQQQKGQQRRGKPQPYQKRQQQKKKEETTQKELEHTKKEKTDDKELDYDDDDNDDDGWTVVGSRKKGTSKSGFKKTQPIKPRKVGDDKEEEEKDDDDDETIETDEKDDVEELTNEQLHERVRQLEEEVKSFNSRHTKARKLKAKMNIWEKSLASTPKGEALEITVSHVMESIFGSKNLSLLSTSQLCALEELHMNALKNISQAKIIQTQKQQKAIIQEQHKH